MHTPVFRQANGAFVASVTENTGVSRNPAVIRAVPETSPSRVVAIGQILYTETPIKVIFKYLSFSPNQTCRFVSDLVGNPEDRFSHNEAQITFRLILRVPQIRPIKASEYAFCIMNPK